MLLNRKRINYWAKVMAITIAIAFAIGPLIGLVFIFTGTNF